MKSSGLDEKPARDGSLLASLRDFDEAHARAFPASAGRPSGSACTPPSASSKNLGGAPRVDCCGAHACREGAQWLRRGDRGAAQDPGA
jgi:hypothetical protein